MPRYKVVQKENSLAYKHPLLAEQWSDKNMPLTPSDVTTGSEKMIWWKGTCGHEWQTSVKNRVLSPGCPICSSQRLLKGFNDLDTRKPELVQEWSEKNLPLLPDMVFSRSRKRVWWRCHNGHEWIAGVKERYYGSGCPYCAGHRLYKGFNDLASRYPDLAAEWSNKNGSLQPENVFSKSRENVWWKCKVCGYEWRAVIDSRVRGTGCPVCGRRKTVSGINDLATTDPDMLSEWDYERNTGITPNRISRYSRRMVWWKGSCGHSWKARVASKVLDHKPCRVCEEIFEKEFPELLLRYYVEQAGYSITINEEELIGIPLSNYINEKNAVIEISRQSYNHSKGYRREVEKTLLCHKARIKLIRILTKDDIEFDGCVSIIRMDTSDESLIQAIITAMKVLGIPTDSCKGINRAELYRIRTSLY